MISTVSFSFDLTASPPRAVITDSTTYPFPVDFFSTKGYGVLSFNGDIIETFDSPSNPLIDLEAGDTVGYINLPLDNNNNVANGVYSFQYSLRLDSGVGGAGYTGTVSGNTTFTSGAEWLVDVLPIGSSISLDGVANTVAAAEVVGSDAVITLSTPATNGSGVTLTFNNDVSLQFSGTYAYSGCTQTTADVNFIYDCEYGNSGTWSVSNATVLGANEIVSSLSCTVNYPSWTNIDPLFNPQIVTTSLPYPTLPTEDTPLATGTYSILLSEQIQQTQTSGLVVTYVKSITKEFTVSCAGTLCGLVPCIENLRAAHATELIRNKVSKYQVYVDNVALYYLEAMNYKACGELDKYKETIALLEAQLDASGCECACCDDETYYWVSNNSANSIIDELLANFQFRLYDGGGDDPGPAQTGVELGALWEDTSTGIIYRCTNATPTNLIWEEYYDPSVVYPTGADNGLSISSGDVVLGGSLDNDTTINLGFRNLDFTSTSGNLEFAATNGGNMVVSTNAGTAIDVTGTGSALKVEGTVNALDVLATTSTAGILKVQRAVDNTVAVNLVLQTSVDSAPGANGLGSSIRFDSEGSTSSIVTTGSIQSVLTSASAPTTGDLKFNVRSTSGLVNSFNLNDDASVTLPFYGDGNYTGTPTYSLGVDVDGNVIESNPINNASNGVSISGNDVVLGGSLDANTTIDLGTRSLDFTGTTGNVSMTASIGTALSLEGTTNALDVTATTNTAATLEVNRATNNTVATNLVLQTSVDAGVGATGIGSSIQFKSEGASTTITTAAIESPVTNASTGRGNLEFKVKAGGASPTTSFILNDDLSATLKSYGAGNYAGTASQSLSVDSAGNIIESAFVKIFAAKVTSPSPGVYTLTKMIDTTGGVISMTYSGGTYTISSSNSAFTVGRTFITATLDLGTNAIFTAFYSTASQIFVQTTVPGSSPIDGLLDGYIKIEIYP